MPHASLLNTDGARHPRENILAVGALTLGLAALVLGVIPDMHLFGSIAGAVGLALALYSQLVSITTGQRWFNVFGMVSAFMGLAFSLSHGGFSM